VLNFTVCLTLLCA